MSNSSYDLDFLNLESNTPNSKKNTFFYNLGFKLGEFTRKIKPKLKKTVDTIHYGINDHLQDIAEQIILEQEYIYKEKLRNMKLRFTLFSLLSCFLSFCTGMAVIWCGVI